MPIPQHATTAAAASQGFVAAMRPSLGSTRTDAALPIAPNDSFFLRHHPRNWRLSTTLEEPTYLPEVSMMILAPGVNGVRTTDRGEEPHKAYEDAVTRDERLGWVFLHPGAPVPTDCLPDGMSPGGYRRELDCRDPVTGRSGVYHLEAWRVPLAGLGDERQRFRFDTAAYERWLLHLVESGAVQPMDPSLADAQAARVMQHVERVESSPLPDAVRERRTAQKQAVADAHLAAAARARGETSPSKPTTSKTSKPATKAKP